MYGALGEDDFLESKSGKWKDCSQLDEMMRKFNKRQHHHDDCITAELEASCIVLERRAPAGSIQKRHMVGPGVVKGGSIGDLGYKDDTSHDL